MVRYRIDNGLSRCPDEEEGAGLVLVTSQEITRLQQTPEQRKIEDPIAHTPAARDARVCKAETRHGFLCGDIVVPRALRDGQPMAFGYLLTPDMLVLCDDSDVTHSMIARKQWGGAHRAYSPGSLLCELLESLLARDLRHLQELEDELARLEDLALDGELDGFTSRLSAARKEIARWARYYTQLEDMACAIQENDCGFLSEDECALFHLVEKRIGRLQNEAQTLREYGVQVRELFQSEIDIRQNRIMKILTIVTTIFLPLSLVAGWYGMNFTGMPELSWEYGYPAVIAASAIIVLFCLWLMKKKKFW